jgi:hypothetical protein
MPVRNSAETPTIMAGFSLALFHPIIVTRVSSCSVLGASKTAKNLLLLALLCMFVRMERLGFHWTDTHEVYYLGIFRKSVEKIQVLLKSDKSNGYFI